MKKYIQGKFIPKNKQKYVGDVNNIFARSSWEYYFLNWLDKNDAILEYSSEEIIILYFDPSTNRNRRYFPDIWMKCKTRDGNIQEYLIEIKPFNQTIPPKEPKKKTKQYIQKVLTYVTNQAKWEAASEFADNNNMIFKVLTEREILNQK